MIQTTPWISTPGPMRKDSRSLSVSECQVGVRNGVDALLHLQRSGMELRGIRFFRLRTKDRSNCAEPGRRQSGPVRVSCRGGKLIIDNGWMDASLSAHGTIDYYDSVLDLRPDGA